MLWGSQESDPAKGCGFLTLELYPKRLYHVNMTIILSRMEASPEVIQAIREAMNRKGITQTELAKLAGISQPNVSHILSGKRGKISSEMTKVLDALGLELCVKKK
jgi:antitoxin component HigA of HigAB toxin-antitoxin module